MDVTSATADDGDRLRDVAGRSIRASYSISPDDITSLVDQEFREDRLAERRDDDDAVALLAEDDGEALGFVTGALSDDGTAEIDWLFVAPEARGMGVGTRLFEAGRDALADLGAETVNAMVLSENEEGEQFFEQFGYGRLERREFEIDEEAYTGYVYGPESDVEEGDRELHTPDSVETDDGTVYTGDEELSGKDAPFLVLYTDEERTEQYGFFCTNCGSLANAADGLDRVDCDTCGNESSPEEWDGSYL